MDFQIFYHVFGALLILLVFGSSDWIVRKFKNFDFSKLNLNDSADGSKSDEKTFSDKFWGVIGWLSNLGVLFLLGFRLTILIPIYVGIAVFQLIDSQKLKNGVFDSLKKALTFDSNEEGFDMDKIASQSWPSTLLTLWKTPAVFAENTGIFHSVNDDGSVHTDGRFRAVFVSLGIILTSASIGNAFLLLSGLVIGSFLLIRAFFNPKNYAEGWMDVFAWMAMASFCLHTAFIVFLPLIIPAIINFYGVIRNGGVDNIKNDDVTAEAAVSEDSGC